MQSYINKTAFYLERLYIHLIIQTIVSKLFNYLIICCITSLHNIHILSSFTKYITHNNSKQTHDVEKVMENKKWFLVNGLCTHLQ